MATGPSSPAIQPSPEGNDPPPAFRPDVLTVMVGWLLGWPVVVYVCLPYVKPINTFQACLLTAGTFFWLIARTVICDALFTLAEMRWPVVGTIRKILRIAVGILRAIRHSSPT
jgi:hypothetical protein